MEPASWQPSSLSSTISARPPRGGARRREPTSYRLSHKNFKILPQTTFGDWKQSGKGYTGSRQNGCRFAKQNSRHNKGESANFERERSLECEFWRKAADARGRNFVPLKPKYPWLIGEILLLARRLNWSIALNLHTTLAEPGAWPEGARWLPPFGWPKRGRGHSRPFRLSQNNDSPPWLARQGESRLLRRRSLPHQLPSWTINYARPGGWTWTEIGERAGEQASSPGTFRLARRPTGQNRSAASQRALIDTTMACRQTVSPGQPEQQAPCTCK